MHPAFYRWLDSNYRALFPELPERTRLQRLLGENAEYALDFLAAPEGGILGIVLRFGLPR